jgi:hypothetical protein
MEVNVGPLKEGCNLKKKLLRMIYGPVTIMVYGKQDTIVSFIRSTTS